MDTIRYDTDLYRGNPLPVERIWTFNVWRNRLDADHGITKEPTHYTFGMSFSIGQNMYNQYTCCVTILKYVSPPVGHVLMFSVVHIEVTSHGGGKRLDTIYRSWIGRFANGRLVQTKSAKEHSHVDGGWLRRSSTTTAGITKLVEQGSIRLLHHLH